MAISCINNEITNESVIEALLSLGLRCVEINDNNITFGIDIYVTKEA